MNIKRICEKNKDVIFYLFFGVCTTLVNVIAYWGVAHLLRMQVMPSTGIAWVLAVLFAYVTNRKWVFHSTAVETKEIIQECLSFFICRIATGVMDWLCMFILVEKLAFNDVIVKLGANALAIVFNYLASKMVIFKK